ncbi:Lrp/AsnC family transcriptional regulator [Jannaschia donghaensis]|uniref:DNA-binding transcriptional regulator AsnC n=1 Tax=Jannaschia donghaensis TaxID=420998 RepID=A0A0M6YF11_9RHOB|nr:Lrp/AsnC family transcriptional regulator [Jannaschia donghaensis]CTQ48918.1 DNA-binding transcriptional regulator AsnC [Jannaschia donghaensis]
MDDTDHRLLALLARDGRASVSSLAATLKLTRATVRARMDRLTASGDLLGFRAVLKADLADRPVRGIILIEIEGTGAARVARIISAIAEVEAVHSTHGRWDLVAELGADTLEALDTTLNRIRMIDGVSRSETNLYLSTRRG